MSEPTTEEFLHSFGTETAHALKKEAVRAKDVIELTRVYNEAHRLQRIVTSLGQDHAALDASIAAATLQFGSLKASIDAAHVQLVDDNKLVDEMRASAEASIVQEVEAFKQAEYQRGKTAVEALLSESNREYAAVQEKIATAGTQLETVAAQRGAIEHAITVLQATKKQLIVDITAAS